MRNIFYLLIIGSTLCLHTTASAQKNSPYEMTVKGVKVIVQPSNNQIVEIQTIIKGGVQNYPAGKAGIESLAMSALTECGTKSYDKNTFKNMLDKVSAQVYGFTGMDYASFNMNCILTDFDAVWPLYAEAFTAPRFDPNEFARIKQDAVNQIRAQSSQPDYAIDQMARSVAFAGRDYAKRPEGTEKTVATLTPTETKAYYESIRTRSRMVIVVVGEIERAVLEKHLEAMLSNIPDGKAFTLKKESYRPASTTFNMEKKDVATNYVQAVTGGPLPGTPDFNAYSLAMRIFADRDFLYIRTKNGLSYAPQSWFNGALTPSTNIAVSTTEPNRYVQVLSKLIDSTRKFGFSEEEVRNMKTSYLTNVYYREETNSAQAAALASNEVLHNNWRRAININEEISKLNVADINNAFNKYFTNLTWVYQGKPDAVNQTLYLGAKKPVKQSSTLQTKKKQ
jgi:zinc protease